MSAQATDSVLICGVTGSGKTSSLYTLKDPSKALLFGCGLDNKPLPFRKNGLNYIGIEDPMDLLRYLNGDKPFPESIANNDIELILIDTLTGALDSFVDYYITPAEDTRTAWGELPKYFNNLLLALRNTGIRFVCFAHLQELTDKYGNVSISVPVKGSLSTKGLESYFTTVVRATKIDVTAANKYSNDLLHYDQEDKVVHVFQTHTDSNTIGDRVKTPRGMFDKKTELYINNDINYLLQRVDEYYK